MKAVEFIVEGMPEGVDKLASLLIFLRDRAQQINARPQISFRAFSTMAQRLGIPLNYDSFDNLVQTNPTIQNLVQDYNNNTVIFKNIDGQDDQSISSPSDVDVEPTSTVDKMAKRALKKRI